MFNYYYIKIIRKVKTNNSEFSVNVLTYHFGVSPPKVSCSITSRFKQLQMPKPKAIIIFKNELKIEDRIKNNLIYEVTLWEQKFRIS